jgi:hypothetical protein
MNKFSVVLCLFLYQIGFSTEIPSDSIIQSVLSQHCISNDIGVQCSNMYDEGSLESDFSVSFKDTLTLDKEKYLFVVSIVENGSQHGHTFGCESYFFLQKQVASWEVVSVIIENKPMPIMGLVSFELIQIGIERMALVSVSESTGNHHYERGVGIAYIQLDRLDYVFSLREEYSNLAWHISVLPDEECKGYRTTAEFHVIQSENEWFDIEVIENQYVFSQGCENEILKTKLKHLYVFSENKYQVQ